MNPLPEPQPGANTGDLFGPLWRRKWLIVAIVAVATAGTYFASKTRTEKFRATSRVLVQSSVVQGVFTQQQPVDPDRDTADQAQLITSRSVAEAVSSQLHLRQGPQVVLGSVKATATAGSGIVSVTAERGSAQGAAEVANTFVRQYLALRSSGILAEIDGAIHDARRQIAALPAGADSAQQRSDLRDAITRLQSARAQTPAQVRQVDPAIAPQQAFSPRPRRDTLFGLIIAALFALALAFALERFDRRLKRPEDGEVAYGLPLLATIPHASSPGGNGAGSAAMASQLREPFRWLRTSIDLASQGQPLRTIVVSSAMKGEGKSTVVRNLAIAYLEWGHRVLVIEADLRQPALCEMFGVSRPRHGLTSVVTREKRLADVQIDVHVDLAGLVLLERLRSPSTAGGNDPAASPADAANGGGRLTLIPSGEVPPNPQAVLSAMSPLLSDIATEYDTVLIDTPPILAASDAVPIIGMADGVVVVGRIGLTTSDAAQRLVTELRRVRGGPLLGVVVNDLPNVPGAAGYGYGYGYDESINRRR